MGIPTWDKYIICFEIINKNWLYFERSAAPTIAFSSHVKAPQRGSNYELLSLMPFKGLEKTICNGKFVEQAKTLSSDIELRIVPTGLIRFNETSNA